MKHSKPYKDTNFATRMRLLMGARNVKLKDIATATSCSISAASTWRRGRLPRNYKTISKLARIFDVSENFLINGDEECVIFSNEKSCAEKSAKNSVKVRSKDDGSERRHSESPFSREREVMDIFKKLATLAAESDDGYSILFERLLKAFPEAAPNNGENSEKNMANKMFA